VAALIAAGIIPAGLEMMDQTSSRMVEPFVHAGYDTEAAAILLCEADGTAEEVEEEIARMSACCSRPVRCDRRVAVGSGADEVLVRPQECLPAAGRISPDYYCMDGTIPRKRLGRCWRGSRRWRSSMACAAPMCSMRAMATCTR
jgi:glycolate oxidase